MPEPRAPVRVGVVGTGSQGEHHVRLLAGLGEADLVGIYDSDAGVAEAVADRYRTRAFASMDALAGEIEAAVVATPTHSHADIGRRLLAGDVHVLMEKPLASDPVEARALLDAAAERVLAVGHVEYFNPAVRALLDLEIDPGFIEVHRLAEFKPRSLDIDVVLDLMIHDLQILHALDGSEIEEIRASGIHVLTDRIDIASVRIELASGCVANLTASRVSRDPIRKLRVFSRSGAYYSLDYASRKVGGACLVERDGSRRIVEDTLAVAEVDPLTEQLRGFLRACRGERARYVDGAQGARVLDTALEVLRQLGSGRGEPR